MERTIPMEMYTDIGAISALFLAATGSCFGIGAAAMAAIGAFKKNVLKGETPPFIIIAFVGAPISQTIYGMILMNAIVSSPSSKALPAGVFGGLIIGLSAFFQGKAGALASDAMGETKKGFGFFIMVLGILETVGLFGMVFIMAVL